MSDDYSDNGTSRSWLERVGQFFTSTPGSRDELLDLMRSMRDSDVIDGDTLGNKQQPATRENDRVGRGSAMPSGHSALPGRLAGST